MQLLLRIPIVDQIEKVSGHFFCVHTYTYMYTCVQLLIEIECVCCYNLFLLLSLLLLLLFLQVMQELMRSLSMPS